MSSAAATEKAQIVDLLLALADRAQSAVASTLSDFGAPPSTAPTLRILATTDEPVTPRDLARLLGRDPSTATLIADKLEAAGLVARHPHPHDGRRRVLVLSERGQDLWVALRERLHDAALFDALSGAERSELLTLLGRMRDAGAP